MEDLKNILHSSPIYIINLDRRTDRWEEIEKKLKESSKIENQNYHRYKAVDGRDLQFNLSKKEDMDLIRIFRHNDFNYRQSVIACALSHLNLWKQLVQDTKNYYYVILEDDLTFVENFNEKLNLTLHFLNQNPKVDIHFLGHNLWGSQNIYNPEISNNNISFKIMDIKIYNGGAFGYIISKAAASKFIHIAETKGIKRGIDKFIEDNLKHITSTHSSPNIVYTEYVTALNNVDSDIQRNFETVKLI